MVSDRSATLDAVFHALAHPTRRAMLRRLSKGERTLGELAAPFRMSLPAGSKHVRVLERAGFVRRTIVGRTHVCRLDAAPLGQVVRWAEEYRRFWEQRFRGLDDVLAGLGDGEDGGGPRD